MSVWNGVLFFRLQWTHLSEDLCVGVFFCPAVIGDCLCQLLPAKCHSVFPLLWKHLPLQPLTSWRTHGHTCKKSRPFESYSIRVAELVCLRDLFRPALSFVTSRSIDTRSFCFNHLTSHHTFFVGPFFQNEDWLLLWHPHLPRPSPSYERRISPTPWRRLPRRQLDHAPDLTPFDLFVAFEGHGDGQIFPPLFLAPKPWGTITAAVDDLKL